ncbi:MAG: hypothetical protein ACE5JA_02885 [bacterium]
MSRVLLLVLFIPVLAGSSFPETIEQMMREDIVGSVISSDRYPPQIGYGIKYEGADKSPPLALFLSAALPGAGEYYMGSTGRSKAFFGIELATWASYLAFTYHGRRVRDRYKLFAAANASADMNIDSEEYWNAIEWNATNEDHNERVREDARALYPGDFDRQQEYIREHIYTGRLSWSWKDGGATEEFRRLRRESRDAFQYAIYSTGFALLNRLVSLMDVILITRSGEKKPPTGKRVQLIIEPEKDVVGFRVGIAVKG